MLKSKEYKNKNKYNNNSIRIKRREKKITNIKFKKNKLLKEKDHKKYLKHFLKILLLIKDDKCKYCEIEKH
jgi:hypothetical protein